MRLFNAKYSLLSWVSLILVAGFLTTSLAAYLASRDAIEHGIADQALPLTGDNIYSEIQKDILRPVFISSLMAHDTFVRDWILNGEKNPAQLVRYLNEVKQKYGTVSSFLVSNRSSRYYHAAGTLKSVRAGEPRDAWFFRVRAMRADYETNVGPDMANRDSVTIFINHRVSDYAGNFIGATGVGLTLDSMSYILDRYRERFQRNIYFVDAAGEVVLSGKAMRKEQTSIRNLPGVRDIAARILNHDDTPTQLDYRLGKARIMVNSRFIPELNWYLVVEQNVSDEVRPVQRVLIVNLAISFVVTLLVLALTLLTVQRYQRRIERLAATDTLTGLLNRQALETIFHNAILGTKRSGKPLAAILLDIDHFKQVNDRHGHLQGDQVIRAVAGLARAAVRESDVVTRWGGEEYLILLGDCTLEQAARIAENLRAADVAHEFGLGLGLGLDAEETRLSVSLGVAQFEQGETETAFFARADSALYRAKDAGRNRLALAPAAG